MLMSAKMLCYEEEDEEIRFRGAMLFYADTRRVARCCVAALIADMLCVMPHAQRGGGGVER